MKPLKALSIDDVEIDARPLSPEEKFSRVLALCESTLRNVAYYQAGWESSAQPLMADSPRSRPQRRFWRQVNSNCADQLVLEWCKLFDGRDNYTWQKVLSDPGAFEAALYSETGLTKDLYAGMKKTMCRQRDKFVAHMDHARTMLIPDLAPATTATILYYLQIVNVEAHGMDCSDGRPSTVDALRASIETCKAEARSIYAMAFEAQFGN